MLQNSQNTDSQIRATAKRPKVAKRNQRLGYMVIDGQPGSLPCTVRDFSETGAILSMSGWMGVPDNFGLFVEPDSVKVDCRVLQKRGSKVQVEFTDWQDDVRYRNRPT